VRGLHSRGGNSIAASCAQCHIRVDVPSPVLQLVDQNGSTNEGRGRPCSQRADHFGSVSHKRLEASKHPTLNLASSARQTQRTTKNYVHADDAVHRSASNGWSARPQANVSAPEPSPLACVGSAHEENATSVKHPSRLIGSKLGRSRCPTCMSKLRRPSTCEAKGLTFVSDGSQWKSLTHVAVNISSTDSPGETGIAWREVPQHHPFSKWLPGGVLRGLFICSP